MKYMSSIQMAEKWGFSPRWVITLCKDGRITGAQQAGKTWIIPEDAVKPADARIKSGKYVKLRSMAQAAANLISNEKAEKADERNSIEKENRNK